MKQTILTLIILLILGHTLSYADPIVNDMAEDLGTDTTNFDNILSATEDDIQKALDVLDDIAPDVPGAVTIDAKVAEAGGIAICKVVYISGATGEKPQVELASNLLHDPAHILGVAAEAGSSGQTIDIRVYGELGGCDTDGFAEGARLHLNSDGNYQEAVLTSGAHIHVGFVTKVNVNTGIIFVLPEVYAHDIRGTSDLDVKIAVGSNDGTRKILFNRYDDANLGYIDGAGDLAWLYNVIIGVDGTSGSLKVYSSTAGSYHEWAADGDFTAYNTGDVTYTGYDGIDVTDGFYYGLGAALGRIVYADLAVDEIQIKGAQLDAPLEADSDTHVINRGTLIRYMLLYN